MPLDLIPEPWLGFLSELDAECRHPVDFHCLGGFVVTNAYGLARTTSDIDVLMFVPKTEVVRRVQRLEGADQEVVPVERHRQLAPDFELPGLDHLEFEAEVEGGGHHVVARTEIGR